LLIGDPALHLDPDQLPYHVADLGAEWTELTGLPMVFAIWAGRKDAITPQVEAVFHASYQFGRSHLEDIIRAEALSRGLSRDLAEEYLTRRIICELGKAEYEGLDRFLEYSRATQEVAV
jgi:predicted solute-binding protein